MARKISMKALMIFVVSTIIVGCTGSGEREPLSAGNLQPVTGRDLRVVDGQTIYVPAYSEIFSGRERSYLELAVTLAIHNADLDSPIIVEAVRFYDTDGNLVRSYIDEPIEISPLATTGFLVDDRDLTGGFGSNFIVEWVAEVPVTEPVVEALMVSTRGTQGVSIVSVGRVIAQRNGDSEEPQAGD